MLDDMLDYLQHIRNRPVWQPIPDTVRERFREPLPLGASLLDDAHETFLQSILPYAVGNAHPGFMGWVHGGGTPVGMLAEMLAAGLNANLGGRNQIPVEVERQVVAWMRELFGFPERSSGLVVTGTSMANFLAVLVARTAFLGTEVRREGVNGNRLVGYTSQGAHGSVVQAFELAGLGSQALRIVPVDELFQMDIEALTNAVRLDKAAGLTPFFVVGTAGTVNTGAIDNLEAIAAFAKNEGLWFHVDGAFGALAMLCPDIRPRLSGMRRADSIAFDFHKWGQVPYDAGFILVRNGELHRSTFAANEAYLKRESRGLAGGSPWPCDFGPELSRGFRALKVWFTFKVLGAENLGKAIATTCDVAGYLCSRIEQIPKLELLAPVSLNIVCFRYRCPDPDKINAEIVIRLQESGISAPSTTTINGNFAIRAAIVNHRTDRRDIDRLVDSVVSIGDTLTGKG